MTKKHTYILGAAAIAVVATQVFSQGPLTPPGAPAPTMKTLDQIEPRTALIFGGASMPGVSTGNLTAHFIISEPGSYYLTSNLKVTRTNGIRISGAEGVTLDLNGFEISREGTPSGNGIEISPVSAGASIFNGSIKGFSYGINSPESSGVTASGCAFRNLSISSCTTFGLKAGGGSVVDSCRVFKNQGERALSVGPSSTLSNCTAKENSTWFAIFVDDGGTLKNCTAEGNNGNTSAMYAGKGSSFLNCNASNNDTPSVIYADSGCSLTNCSSSNNNSTFGFRILDNCSLLNCTSSSNSSGAAFFYGFQIRGGCSVVNCTASDNFREGASERFMGRGFNVLKGGTTLERCTASNNGGDGIGSLSQTNNKSEGFIVRNCLCINNGRNAGITTAGIYVSFDGCRIEGNHVMGENRGIQIDAEDSLVIKNSVQDCSVSYEIDPGNRYGQIVDLSAPAPGMLGASSGGNLQTTDPWANFSQ